MVYESVNSVIFLQCILKVYTEKAAVILLSLKTERRVLLIAHKDSEACLLY